jgi:hypothetical protein
MHSASLLQVISPNQKATDRTRNKPDEDLHKICKRKFLLHRRITPCGCLFEQRGVPHVRCYYSYDNGWLYESRKLAYVKRQIAEFSIKTERIDAQIRDLRTARRHATSWPEILEINNKFDQLHAQKRPFMPTLYRLQDELEQAAIDLGTLELRLNGILP